MPHTASDHDDPNYQHTVDDLIDHEIDAFMGMLKEKPFGDILNLRITSINHCKRCADIEDEGTLDQLTQINETLEEIHSSYNTILELVKKRAAILVPRLLVVKHDEDAQ